MSQDDTSAKALVWYPDRAFVEFATQILVPVLFPNYEGKEPDFQYIGGDQGRGLLESSLARPKPLFGQERYPTIEAKAAALIWSITKNHPFNDGNKRVALITGFCFLIFNRVFVVAQQADAVDMCLGIAAGKEGYDESYITSWLRERCQSIDEVAEGCIRDSLRHYENQLSGENSEAWSYLYGIIAAVFHGDKRILEALLSERVAAAVSGRTSRGASRLGS